jgi:hypothetical protein
LGGRSENPSVSVSSQTLRDDAWHGGALQLLSTRSKITSAALEMQEQMQNLSPPHENISWFPVLIMYNVECDGWPNTSHYDVLE